MLLLVFFDQLNPSESSIAFDLAQGRGKMANAVDVLVSYDGGGRKLYSNRLLLYQLPLMFLLRKYCRKLEVAESAVQVGDVVTFTFDGTTPSGTFRSSQSLKVPVSCFSDLGGIYTYVSTNLLAANSATSCPTGEVTGEEK